MTLRGVAGQKASGVVLMFHGVENELGRLSASIKWGDGTKSGALVLQKDATDYGVSGGHTYSRAGRYRLRSLLFIGSRTGAPSGTVTYFSTTVIAPAR